MSTSGKCTRRLTPLEGGLGDGVRFSRGYDGGSGISSGSGEKRTRDVRAAGGGARVFSDREPGVGCVAGALVPE